MITDEEFINAIKIRYSYLNPLIIHRSIEKSSSKVELFDILESIPKFPFYWEETTKQWTKTTDFYFLGKVKNII